MSFAVNDPSRPSLSSLHPGGASAIGADRTYRLYPDGTDPARLRALITGAAGPVGPGK